LACGYYDVINSIQSWIKKKKKNYGGAWLHARIRLFFSPAQHSSFRLADAKSENLFPLKQVIDYLCQYEKRYELPIERSVTENITSENKIFEVYQ
jgi:hypothetical protein